jgi:hypothetical protein
MTTTRLSRTSVEIGLFALAALALLLSSVRIARAHAAVPDPPRKDGVPKKQAGAALDVKGQLQDNDPKDPKRDQPCKTYMVKLKKSTTYIIDMASVDFDSYLRLENVKGVQVAEDDDSGRGVTGLDAQIVFTPETDGTFKVVATRFADGTGNFALAVRELSYRTGKVQPIDKGELKIESKLTSDEPLDPLGPKHHYKVYSVKMVAGRRYTIDLVSNRFDAFLRLHDAQFKKLAEDDDSGGNLNSRIVFMAKADGVYHIVATTFDGDLGVFTLTVREQK